MFTLPDLNANTKLFIDAVTPVIDSLEAKNIILTDADETISKQDTSRIFCECNNLDEIWQQTRLCFKNVGRNYDGFAQVAKIYSDIPPLQYQSFCMRAAEKTEIREYFQCVLEQDLPIIIVTSGLRTLWEYIAQLKKWHNVIVIGGNSLNETPFIVTPKAKDILSNLLKQKKKKILAFGDSRLDAQMLLNADMGCIVTNERYSPGLVDMVKTCNTIVQLESEYSPTPELPILSIKQVLDRFYRTVINK